MCVDISEFCKYCESCQKLARKTKFDNIPIKPVERGLCFNDIVSIDLIGPIDPPSYKGHKYILTIIDSCTKWPEIEPQKTLTAKELCDKLVTIWCRNGWPRVCCSDNATNMVAGLITELYKRFGGRDKEFYSFA